MARWKHDSVFESGLEKGTVWSQVSGRCQILTLWITSLEFGLLFFPKTVCLTSLFDGEAFWTLDHFKHGAHIHAKLLGSQLRRNSWFDKPLIPCKRPLDFSTGVFALIPSLGFSTLREEVYFGLVKVTLLCSYQYAIAHWIFLSVCQVNMHMVFRLSWSGQTW